MQLNELGYNRSERDYIFEAIWNRIGDEYTIKPSPVKNAVGNVIILPDDVYWDCDKIVKINDVNKDKFKQKWTMYRPSIFAIKHNLVNRGCLIYNQSWYTKYVTGEVENDNIIREKIKNNIASVKEVSKVNWGGKDLNEIGIWSIKTLGGKILGLYLSLDEYFSDIWKKEREEQTLIFYETMNNNGLKYDKVLTVADMVSKINDISKKDMENIHIGLGQVFNPVDLYGKRSLKKMGFSFESNIEDEVVEITVKTDN